MTVAVVVTLLIAAPGGCRWAWARRASGPRLPVEGYSFWAPGQFRAPLPPGGRRDELIAYEVVVRNDGGTSAVIESWGITARSGTSLAPPFPASEHAS
jgi:hypothetical protein